MLAGHHYERMRYDRVISKLPASGAWCLADVRIVGNAIFTAPSASVKAPTGREDPPHSRALRVTIPHDSADAPIGMALCISDHYGLLATFRCIADCEVKGSISCGSASTVACSNSHGTGARSARLGGCIIL
jgi:hypothetical protein